MKKDLPAIVAAHGVPYVATASIAFLKDLRNKVSRAMEFHGSRYIQIDQPCTSVWGFPTDQTMEVARLAVNSGLVPLFEMENGELTRVRKISAGKKVPVSEYLKIQKRFCHLLQDEAGQAEIRRIQDLADANIRKYGLMD
jgi:pyruvate ferredoxin oxidoreductase beta subunit